MKHWNAWKHGMLDSWLCGALGGLAWKAAWWGWSPNGYEDPVSTQESITLGDGPGAMPSWGHN